mgnify:CR=1 FL=1
MMHLTEDQIYHLVEAIGNHETLTAEEEQQMEHIRSKPGAEQPVLPHPPSA